jgi:hypothetical protein
VGVISNALLIQASAADGADELALYMLYTYMIKQRKKVLGNAPGSGHKLVESAPNPDEIQVPKGKGASKGKKAE